MMLVKYTAKRVTTDAPSRSSWDGAAEDDRAETVGSPFTRQKK